MEIDDIKLLEHRVSKLEIDNKGTKVELKEVRANLEKASKIIIMVADELVEIKQTIKESNKRAEINDKQIEKNSKMIAENGRQIQELKESIAENGRQIQELKESIAENGRQIQELKETVAENSRQIATLKEESAKRDEEIKEFKREMNKKWGELANKMGTIVEDIVYPNIGGVAKKYFKAKTILFKARNITKRVKELDIKREFDVIVECDDFVLVNETKSSPNKEKLNEFYEFIKSNQFLTYFPEYKNKKIHYIFSALYLEKELVDECTKLNIFAMAMGEENLDILNTELLEKIHKRRKR